MNESDKTYYYASPGGQATGPVSEQELRKMLEQGTIKESANILRKGDAQWRRLSDVFPPQAAAQPAPPGAGNMSPSDKTYYYAPPGGQATGPVSEQELRKLLAQGVIHESANVIRKGETQWRQIKHMLKDHEQTGRDEAFVPPPVPACFPPLPTERHEENRVSAVDGAARMMDIAEKTLNDLNTFIDNRLYSLFGFRKLVPHFKKWVNFTIHLTSVMTILTSILFAFAVASIASEPKPMYMTPYSTFNPRAMETAQKAVESDSGMSGGTFMAALGGGFLLGVILQYISGLFSKANVNYFYSRKPVLSSMLLPRLNVIILCILLLGTLISLFFAKGIFIFLAILALASQLYMIWLHLNCDRLFMKVTDKEASGPSDLIGYMMYQLRFSLVAAQTLIPVWLLGLCGFCCFVLFSGDRGGFLVRLLMSGELSVWGVIGWVSLLAAPVALHLCYIFAALLPELLLSILKGGKKS